MPDDTTPVTPRVLATVIQRHTTGWTDPPALTVAALRTALAGLPDEAAVIVNLDWRPSLCGPHHHAFPPVIACSWDAGAADFDVAPALVLGVPDPDDRRPH